MKTQIFECTSAVFQMNLILKVRNSDVACIFLEAHLIDLSLQFHISQQPVQRKRDLKPFPD